LVIYGSLNAEGTSSEPITITSIKDDSVGGDTNANGSLNAPAAGDWRRILFKSGSSSTLSNMNVSYGGEGNVGALTAESGAVVQTSSITFTSNVKNSEGL
ncbi:MAG: hypothetical protein HY001_04840, partial [Candidatus Portnoybacteria bacterium]|nr:hypothetical protein [Candidatus Portnoybacteria bacterium]